MVPVVQLEDGEWLSVEVRHYLLEAGCNDAGADVLAATMSLNGVVFDSHHGLPTPNSSVHVSIRFSPEQRYDEDACDDTRSDGVPEGCSAEAKYIGQIHLSVLPLVELTRNASGSLDIPGYFDALRSLTPGPGPEQRRLTVYVHLFLPLSVFSLLLKMKGTRIKLMTIHDSLVNPKFAGFGESTSRSLYVAAFVKRVSFESIDPH